PPSSPAIRFLTPSSCWHRCKERHPKTIAQGAEVGETAPRWGVCKRWRERLSKIAEATSEELEAAQKVMWFASKEIFFWWCQNLSFFGSLASSVCEGTKPRQPGEASSSSTGPKASTEGSLVLMPCQLEEQKRLGKPLKKKRHLIKGVANWRVFLLWSAIIEEQGPIMSQEEDERGQAGEEEFTVLAEGAGESSAGTSPMRVPTMEVIEGDTLSPILVSVQQLSIRARRAAACYRGHRSLDTAARGLCESYTLDPTTPLDMECHGLTERMVHKFLPDKWQVLRDVEKRIHLIDGCASQVEYRYHVLKESPSATLGCHHTKDMFAVRSIMDAEYR
ncbi:hypothetical protein ACLOJK_029288, partial [Asimina triloba]